MHGRTRTRSTASTTTRNGWAAVPYSPVTRPASCSHAMTRRAMPCLSRYQEETGRLCLSSAHVNFPMPAEDAVFPGAWLPRIDVQYHWRNPGHWHDFAGFLADFDHKHPRTSVRSARRCSAPA